MGQSGKVANPARGQVNRENDHFPVPVRAWEFGLTRQVRLSRPAYARLFSILRLNHQSSIWCFFTGILPLSAAASIYLYCQPPLGQSRIYQVTQLRIDGVHCLESADRGPIVLKVVPVTGAAFSGYHHGPINVRLSFPTLTHYYWYVVDTCDGESNI